MIECYFCKHKYDLVYYEGHCPECDKSVEDEAKARVINNDPDLKYMRKIREYVISFYRVTYKFHYIPSFYKDHVYKEIRWGHWALSLMNVGT